MGAFGDVVDEGVGAEFAQRFLEVRTGEAEHGGGALGRLLPGERRVVGELGEITDAEVVHQLLYVLSRDLRRARHLDVEDAGAHVGGSADVARLECPGAVVATTSRTRR